MATSSSKKMEDSTAPNPNEENLGFAFNDIGNSDRDLRLEITPLATNVNSGVKKYLNWFSSIHGNDSNHDTQFKSHTLHISSPKLGANSRFFYRLFKTGMRESDSKDHVTLRINASEKAAFINLLNYIYGKNPSGTSAPDLLDLLMAAEVFEVPSCLKYCVQSLLKLPISLESANLYLEIPSMVFAAEVVQPLTDAAKNYLASHYQDFTKWKEQEMMSWPLAAVEAVLGINSLILNSEDGIFDFIFKWARVQYPKLEERQKIISKLLEQFVCFSNMSCWKLKNVIESADFDSKVSLKPMLKALLISKFEALGATTKSDSFKRVYNLRLIRVVNIEFSQPRCVVYFDLKKADCAALYPANHLFSQSFFLGGRYFYLMAQCKKKPYHSERYFGIHVRMDGSNSCSMDVEFAAIKKQCSSTEFQSLCNISNCPFTEKEPTKGTDDLLSTSWSSFIGDNSVYLIDGILHLRVQLTIKN